MAHRKGKSEGGNKRGHSNMCHWFVTAIVKAGAKRARRAAAKQVIKENI